MIVYRLEHVECPEGRPGHGPYMSPNTCRRDQVFGTRHTAPSGDVLQPPQVERACDYCDGRGKGRYYSTPCAACDGTGSRFRRIGIDGDQICGVTAEQLPLWAGDDLEPKLHNGWQIIIYRVDGRFKNTRRGFYQVVFRREDADVVGRITNEEQLEALLKPAPILDTAVWDRAA